MKETLKQYFQYVANQPFIIFGLHGYREGPLTCVKYNLFVVIERNVGDDLKSKEIAKWRDSARLYTSSNLLYLFLGGKANIFGSEQRLYFVVGKFLAGETGLAYLALPLSGMPFSERAPARAWPHRSACTIFCLQQNLYRRSKSVPPAKEMVYFSTDHFLVRCMLADRTSIRGSEHQVPIRRTRNVLTLPRPWPTFAALTGAARVVI